MRMMLGLGWDEALAVEAGWVEAVWGLQPGAQPRNAAANKAGMRR